MTTTEETYNGYSNYETWNVALAISNDEGLYNIARGCRRSANPYRDFVDLMSDVGIKATYDGVRWDDPNVDVNELNDVIWEY